MTLKHRIALALLLACCVGVFYEGIRWGQTRKHVGMQTAPNIPAKKARENRPKLTTEDYMSLCRFFETKDASAVESDRANVTEIMTHIGAFNADQIRALADEFLEFGNYKTKRHQLEILQFAIQSLASRDPESAVLLLKHPSEGMTARNIVSVALPVVLTTWHQQDPGAAENWLRLQIESEGDFIDWDTMSKLPGALAPLDPALALSLMEDLQQRGMRVEVAAITRNAINDKARTAALEAIRQLKPAEGYENLTTLGQIWRGFAENLVAAGPAVSRQWLNSASLTNSEALILSDQIIRMDEPPDRAHWISWMASSLPEGTMPARIRAMTVSWAGANHMEAGNFIHTMPDGAAKQVAIQAFAETVAAIDIDAAEQWALALPPGSRRDDTLRVIRSGFTGSDDE